MRGGDTEKTLFDEWVDFVAIPLDGELGIMPGRALLIGRLVSGERATGRRRRSPLFCRRWFLPKCDNVVTILTRAAMIPAEQTYLQRGRLRIRGRGCCPVTDAEFSEQTKAVACARGMIWGVVGGEQVVMAGWPRDRESGISRLSVVGLRGGPIVLIAHDVDQVDGDRPSEQPVGIVGGGNANHGRPAAGHAQLGCRMSKRFLGERDAEWNKGLTAEGRLSSSGAIQLIPED